MTVRGGENLKRIIDRGKNARGPEILKVGFFETARYPDGMPVATVAAWNEFGTSRAPERPFFRRTVANVRDDVAELLREGVDPETMRVDAELAGRVGAYVVGELQQEITDLAEPPNAPATVALKGSSNPLVDTGQLRQSAAWEVE